MISSYNKFINTPIGQEENILSVVVMLCNGPYFLFFCRGFKLVGPMVIMIYRMLAQDLLRSLICAFILTCLLLRREAAFRDHFVHSSAMSVGF